MNRRRPHLLLAFALVVGVGHVTFPVAASADGPAAVADPVVELVDGSYVPGEVIVRYDDVLDRRELRAITGALDATLPDVTSVPIGPAGSPTRLLTFDDDTPVSSVIESLAGTPGITHVEPNQYRELRSTPNDPRYSNLAMWGLKTAPGADAAGAWADGHTGSRDVIVAVLDSGTQIAHPDLADNIWTNPDEIAGNGIDDDGNGYVDDVNGWDFLRSDNQVYDSASEDLHGTHVSGTIGAVGNNSLGVVGVNWAVSILPVKFLGDTASTLAMELSALEYILDLKVSGHDIVAINNSWGCSGNGCRSDLELEAIDRLGEAGILFVVASGNSGNDNDVRPDYPSTYVCDGGGTRDWDCIVSVTAHDSSGSIPDWTQFDPDTGRWDAGGPHVGASVDLSAPGAGIHSTYPPNTYDTLSGTSMAAPHVTGAIALCASTNALLDGRALRAALLGSTRDDTALATLIDSGGMLDIDSMLERCTDIGSAVTGTPALSVNETITNGHMSAVVDSSDVVGGDIVEVEVSPREDGTCGSTTRWRYETVTSSFTTVDIGLLDTRSPYCVRARVHDIGSASVTGWSEQIVWTTRPGYECASIAYDDALMTAGRAGDDLQLGDDELATPIPIDTAFFGETTATRSMVVASNGYVSLGESGRSELATGAYIHALPFRGGIWPSGLIAPLTADLDPSEGGTVRHVADRSGSTVVTWSDVPHWTASSVPASERDVTFQFAIERATGTITLQYEDLTFSADHASLGGAAITSPDNSAHIELPGADEIADRTAYRCTWTDPGDTAIVLADVGSGGSVAGLPGVGPCVTNCASFIDLGETITLTATPDDGRIFLGWDGGCNGTSSSCTITPTTNTLVSAAFGTGITIDVRQRGDGSGTITSAPDGVVCVDGEGTCSISRAPGTSTTLTVTAATGSAFVAWSDGCTPRADAPNVCDVTPTTDTTITAFLRSTGMATVPSTATLISLPELASLASDTTPTVGDTVTVAAPDGTFDPHERVVITLHSDPVVLADVDAGAAGSLSTTVTIPTSTTSGAHTLVALGQVSGAGVRIGIDVTGVFAPLTPSRILDSRSGPRVGALDGSGAALTVQVTGRGGVPAAGASAVALNVTVVDGLANDFGGYVTVYPCDVARPDASNLNFTSGQTVPNAVIAPLSTAGTVCLYVYGSAHLLVDVSGYIVAGFSPVTPARVLDTRSGVGAVAGRAGALDGSGTALALQVTGRGGVPTTGVSAVALNVTVVDGSANDFGGYVSVFPCDVARPDVSNLNFTSGQTVPNAVIAPVSVDGTVCLYVYGTAHLLVDVSGYFTAGFSPVTPARVVDTRSRGRVGALDGSGVALEVQVTGRGGVPTTGVSAVALNVTVVDGLANDFAGFVSVFPCDVAKPDVSNLNFVSGQTVPNSVIAPLSSSGTVCLYVYGKADLLVDVSGHL